MFAISPSDLLADNFVNCRYDHPFLNTGIGGGVIATGKYSKRSQVNYASFLWIHINEVVVTQINHTGNEVYVQSRNGESRFVYKFEADIKNDYILNGKLYKLRNNYFRKVADVVCYGPIN